MHNLPPAELEALLRASAKGVYPSEAATELLIAHGTWLHRPDFHGACIGVELDHQGDPFAWVEWRDVPGFLEHAAFSGSEGRILRLAGELAGVDSGLPLVELLSSLDDRNSRLVLAAVAHACQLDIADPERRPGPRSRATWGQVPAVTGQVVGEADLVLLRTAISDPGRYTPRARPDEPVPAWSARAVLIALAQRPTETPGDQR